MSDATTQIEPDLGPASDEPDNDEEIEFDIKPGLLVPRLSRISLRHTSTSPYTLADELSVCCVTANLGNANPFVDVDGTNAWLPMNGVRPDGNQYDIIAVGIQEGDYFVKGLKTEDQSRRASRESSFEGDDMTTVDSSSDDDDDDDHYRNRDNDDDDDENIQHVERLADIRTNSNSSSNPKHKSTPLSANFEELKKARASKSAAQPIRKSKGRRHLVHSIDNQLTKSYRLIDEVQSNQMRLRVYVLQRHFRGITNVQKATKNTGIAGVYGNKGGQVLCFSIFSVSLCFVSSHLAAHEGAAHLKRRNESFVEICRDVRVGQKHLDLCSQFHHVFWMGDLNYRTDWSEMPGLEETRKKRRRQEAWDKVYAMVLGDKFSELYQYDELQNQIQQKKAFCEWNTPKPTFAPTFKMLPQTEGNNYQRKRIPSYTDRILYKSLGGFHKDLSLESYDSVPELCTSDHKPVRAGFRINNLRRGFVMRPPAIAALENYFAFTLSNIRINLATSSKPDPYITVLSDPPGLIVNVDAGTAKACRVPPASKRKSKKSIATFEKPILAKVLVANGEEKYFPLCHAIVCVMDHENLGGDDRLGSVCVGLASLWDHCQATGSCQVKETLYLDGLPAGVIQFRVAFKQVKMAQANRTTDCILM
eukprot:m.44890 g.44890  ORF g.44890 m.44890 type:complete len:646 (+) comp19806_c0_seq2:334-2271(+)